ncbi:hypothetical protein XM38_012370 [Halomicronema hongdechloris C2206]|uniref:Uncharacterized protein n=1 Tax=Halomicronema hongdechloris C2206 TaxID=1641165 RepID=A0A1Z3HJ26_9CYAN|nr:hypothetical protein [Halomicronema hongdechloris]ASC70300.1 hypothetical protein XM38_012370 [Halomicronema hongdechloris C2206]
MKPIYRLATAAGCGVASLGIATTAPQLSTLTADDLAAFANGQAVEVQYQRPGRLPAVALGLTALGFLGWWLMDQQPKPVTIADDSQAQPSGQTIEAPPGVEPPKRYIDVAGVLANNLHPTLITGNPRTGKGVVIAQAWRYVKQIRPEATIWVIQPKPHKNEMGYWDGCDRILPVMLEDHAPNDETIAQQLTDFIHEWRRQPTRPTVLVIDEGIKLDAMQPKWYRDFLIPTIKVEMSSGETDDRHLWMITQSPLVADLGLTGGNRAPLRLLAIETPESTEHLHSLMKSYRSIETKPDALVFQQSLSPKKAIFYHSDLGEWMPLLSYKVPSVTVGGTVQDLNRGSDMVQTLNRLYGKGYTSQGSGLNRFGSGGSDPPFSTPEILNRVRDCREMGLNQAQILLALWGVKKGGSQAYKDALDQYKTMIDILEAQDNGWSEK